MHPESKLTTRQLGRFTELVEQRRRRIPVPYLTGSTTFFDMPLRVTPDVLVPRPFTETLLQHYFDQVTKSPTFLVDVGTGSGAIALACAQHFPNTTVWGIDASRKALSVAKHNIRRLRLHNCTARYGNLLLPLQGKRPDVIVANLPYLTTEQLREPSIQAEPRLALHGGKDGLRDIRRLIRQVQSLPSVSTIILELDPRQVPETIRLLRSWSPLFRCEKVSDGHSVRGLIVYRNENRPAIRSVV